MRRTLLVMIGVALLAPVLRAQAPYSNPVIGDPSHVESEAPDPFVLKWNGEYYIYVSGDPIRAWHSRDLMHWDAIGPVLSSSKDPNAWNQADVWAPEVVYRNGKFYMYYTATRKSDDWRVMERERRVGVAVSDSPRGPFVDSGKPVTRNWAIDGDVFRDPNSGEEWLFYSYLDEQDLKGAGLAAQKLSSWNTVEDEPIIVARGDQAWEDKDGDPKNGSLRYTNEAPTVVKHHGRYYMMYSAGSWDMPTYSLGYAESDQPPAGDLRSPGWKKYGPPVLRGEPLAQAPGHNSVVKAPNNVDDINVYHARTVPFVNPWDRLPYVDRLFWAHDRIVTPPPTTGDLAPIDGPAFATTANGNDGHIAAEYAAGKTLEVEPDVPTYRYFIYELNLRRLRAPGKANAGYGAVVVANDKGDDVRVSIEEQRIVLRGKAAGKVVPAVEKPLPAGFVPEALHQLLIVRNGNDFGVALDGVNVLRGSFPLADRTGKFGTFSAGVPCEFGHMAVTPFYDDTFDAPASLDTWQRAGGGEWTVQDGALRQHSTNGLAFAVKGDATLDYEFTASVLWQGGDKGKTGIVAAAAGDDRVLAGFDHDIWPFAKFWLYDLRGGKVAQRLSAGLPRGFRYDEWHTVRVARQGDAFTFYLDGKETIAAHFIIGAAVPGVFTDSAGASFDDAMTRWSTSTKNLLLDGGFETDQWTDQGAPTPDSAWKLSGAARVTLCCAHSGIRRLQIADGTGAAAQTIHGLSPGKYTLHAWATASGETGAQVSASVNGRAVGRMPVRSGDWSRISLNFEVPQGADSVTIQFEAQSPSGTRGLAAADDFYLFKR